jgi:hypothetical protein
MNLESIKQRKDFRLARNGEDYLALLDSNADWIVRSKDDLLLLRRSEEGPLYKLSDKDFTAFVESLEFKRGGVAHGNYKPLMALTLTEIFQVFEYFGMDKEYVLRTHEYECAGGGCSFSFWSFCSSACHAPEK